jgi:sulfite reductase beta subunit-like hemoprotein
LGTSGACGDITRNVVGCPVAGLDRDEILDGTPQLLEVTVRLSNTKEFSNFPRKYKISVSGCSIHCAQPDINCVGRVWAAPRQRGWLRHQDRRRAQFRAEVVDSAVGFPQARASVARGARGQRPSSAITAIATRGRGTVQIPAHDWGAERLRAEIEAIIGWRMEDHNEFIYRAIPRPITSVSTNKSRVIFGGWVFASPVDASAMASSEKSLISPRNTALRTATRSAQRTNRIC